MSRNKAIVLLTFGSFILLAISVGAIVFMSDFLMGRTFQNIGWLIVLLIPIKLAVCIIMLKFEIRAAYSLSTIYSGRWWLSRRLFCLCTAAPAMTMWPDGQKARPCPLPRRRLPETEPFRGKSS